jgi:chlorite dismutase
MSTHQTSASGLDLREQGRDAAGTPVYSDRRTFIQVQAFTGCADPAPLIASLRSFPFVHALYVDVNDPQGIVLATAHEHPDFFVNELRTYLAQSPFAALTLKPDFTMLGRTYSIGYESDLTHVLVHRPLERLCNPALPWVVWYPLRRKGSFEQLPSSEVREIMSEHGRIGVQFSEGGYGVDIRLACHGLDRDDNDFVIGLLGADLFPLSAMVQTMRKTKQTSQYLEKLGPFLVCKVVHQSPYPLPGQA